MSDRQTFITAYISRARAVGLLIAPTPDGCVYLGEGEECRMIAVPCHCEGHDEGWHMDEVPRLSEKESKNE